MNYPPHTSANTLINNKKATLNLTAMSTQIAVMAENRNMTNYNNYVTGEKQFSVHLTYGQFFTFRVGYGIATRQIHKVE